MQPGAHQRPVFPDQGDYVGHRADGHEVQPVVLGETGMGRRVSSASAILYARQRRPDSSRVGVAGALGAHDPRGSGISSSGS